ncbi:MAG: hypothetical protein ACOZAQ_09825 [Pseudomonadota bacterium]
METRSTTLSTSRRKLLGVLALAALGLGSGCAMLQTPEESLRERAQAFWDARKLGDDVTAYKYEELSKRPESTLQNYLKGRAAMEYRRIDIKSVRIVSPTEAEVILDMAYSVPAIGLKKPIEGQSKDPWVLIDGEWYHAFRPAGASPKETTSK